MEDQIWRTSYSTIYGLPCPHCANGKLKFFRDSVQIMESEHSHAEHAAWAGFSEKIFVSILRCDKPNCGEVVAVSGDVQYIDDVPPSHDDPTPDMRETFYPRNFYPPPPVIKVSKALMPNCQADLKSSFALLWSDRAACANRLRSFVEHLLDQLGIRRKKNGETGDRLDLADRLILLEEEHKDQQSIMKALRLVGNRGSHGTTPAFEDLIKCFRLIEAAVIRLVDKPQDDIDKIALELIEKMEIRT